MTATEIVKQLESLGSEPFKKILQNHRAQEPVWEILERMQPGDGGVIGFKCRVR